MHASPPTARHSSSAKQGFTLLELVVVLAIIALVLGGGLTTFVAFTHKQAFEGTEARLLKIQELLNNYRQAFGRLPCPSDIEALQTDAAFGEEVADPGTCTGVNFSAPTQPDVVAGMLPVRTLGLPDEMAFDAWGSRLFYAIDRRFTAPSAFSINQVDVSGKLRLGAPGASFNDEPAIYVLLSHGANRHGAYPRAGGTIRVSGRGASVGGVSDSADKFWLAELENCGCDDVTGAGGSFDNEFAYGPFGQSPTDENDTFDDLVVFKKREQMEFDN